MAAHSSRGEVEEGEVRCECCGIITLAVDVFMLTVQVDLIQYIELVMLRSGC